MGQVSLVVLGWRPEDMLCGARDTRVGLTWSPLGPRPILNEFWSGNDDASGRVVSIAFPPLRRVDIHPEVPNNIVNFDDVFHFILAFKGEPSPFADPRSCP